MAKELVEQACTCEFKCPGQWKASVVVHMYNPTAHTVRREVQAGDLLEAQGPASLSTHHEQKSLPQRRWKIRTHTQVAL